MVLQRVQPRPHGRSYGLNQSLDLAITDLDPGIFKQVGAGLNIGVLDRRPQHDPAQGRSISPFQAQGGVGGAMAPLAIPVLIAIKVQGTKQASYSQVSALDQALLGAGLEGVIELVYQGLHDRLK